MSDTKNKIGDIGLGKEVLVILVGVAVLAVASNFFFFDGYGFEFKSTDEQIKETVVEDALRQYEIVSNGGSQIDICVQAGIVAAAYLQAENQSKYLVWKEIETYDCDNAGL